jgi:serine/threonine protein kinase
VPELRSLIGEDRFGSNTVKTSTHPSENVIAAFAQGQLSDDRSLEIEAHLLECATCSRQLREQPADPFLGLALPSAVAETASANGGMTTPAPETSPSLEIPSQLKDHPRYRVLKALGHGGMGTVYLAEHLKMGRLVALKIIRGDLLDQPEAARRFNQEVQTAARLQHPNIVQAFDADQVEGLHFLVMEYVEGVDVAHYLEQQGPLPIREACEIVRQAALGLQHAHEEGMVHRDLKPHNLMLTPQGQVKILDFGLARFAREQERKNERPLTGSGVVLGTADYIAPEQTRDAHQCDIRADIYSLGCTLYQLLSGRVPFPEGSAVDKMLRHSLDAPTPFGSLCSDLPAELIAVVEKMMAKEPSRRFQTPAEVAVALESFSSPTVPRRRRPARWPFVAVASALIVLAVGLAGAAVYHILTDNGELVITTESDDVEVVIKQGGKLVRIIDTKTDKSITLHSGVYELELKDEAKGLTLNIDKATLTRGKTVLAKIERVPPKTEPVPRESVEEMRRFRWGNADGPWIPWSHFSPDGQLLLVSGCASRARLFDLRTGKMLRDFDTDFPAFLTPDGKRIVTAKHN